MLTSHDCPLPSTGYCDRCKSMVTSRFCTISCKGDPEPWLEAFAKEKGGSKKVPARNSVFSEDKKEVGDMPDIPQLAKNYASYKGRQLVATMKGNPLEVSEEEAAQRWKECQACEQLDRKNRCRLCGCGMKNKTKKATEWCELGKWSGSETVDIIMCSRGEDVTHINKTLASLKANAEGPIQVHLMEDSEGEGRRVLINRAVNESEGTYIFILDPHCSVTEGWDTKLKSHCAPHVLINTRIDAIDENWERLNHLYESVYLTPSLQEKWWGTYHGPADQIDEPVYETMGLTGCGMMMRRTLYNTLGGCNERLGPYGGCGTEWSLKVWLAGGQVLVHREVVLGHLFDTNKDGKLYEVDKDRLEKTYRDMREMFYKGRSPHQMFSVDWLAGKFWPVPEWDKVMESSLSKTMPYGETTIEDTVTEYDGVTLHSSIVMPPPRLDESHYALKEQGE